MEPIQYHRSLYLAYGKRTLVIRPHRLLAGQQRAARYRDYLFACSLVFECLIDPETFREAWKAINALAMMQLTEAAALGQAIGVKGDEVGPSDNIGFGFNLFKGP